MPYKNRLDFLKELRGENNELPFILFTGKGREEVAIQALNLGADGYINKHGYPQTVYGELTHCLKAIVARKKAEELLRRDEAELKVIFESAPDLVMVIDRDLKFVRFNRVIFGSGKPEDFIGKSAIEVLPVSARQFVQSRIEECFATGQMQVFEHDIDGSIVLARVVPIKLNDKINQVAIYSTDITKRYQELMKLIKTQNRHSNIKARGAQYSNT